MSQTYENKAAAERYELARALPAATSDLWMAILKQALPPHFAPQLILDLGAGTGRFARALTSTFDCPLVAVEPAAEMISVGERASLKSVSWRRGTAESIPVEDGSADLVWMSQAFHHLDDPPAAFAEIRRVLTPEGRLAIRNGTQENNAQIEWMRCFPDALEIDNGRLPSHRGLIDLAVTCGFEAASSQTVTQFFASSYDEYYEKISQRGLSSLIAISDEAFNAGLNRLRVWIATQPSNQPVTEPVDFFVFQVADN